MAKKKAPQPARPADERISATRPGPGWKQCSKCKQWIRGPAAPKCFSCGEPFPIKAKPATGKAKPSTSFGEALDTLDRVKGFVKVQGGYDKAVQSVENWEELIEECGGLADLKEAITTLQKWGNK
jgi:hypothetical protein